jgi:hypothetical protein
MRTVSVDGERSAARGITMMAEVDRVMPRDDIDEPDQGAEGGEVPRTAILDALSSRMLLSRLRPSLFRALRLRVRQVTVDS